MRLISWLINWLNTQLYNVWLRATVTPLELKVVKGDFPARTRHIGDTLIVVETEPGKRMVLLRDGVPVCLYFPYTYFIVRYVVSKSGPGMVRYLFGGLQVGFSPTKLSTQAGTVGQLPLSNYDSPMSFCLGNTRPSGVYNSVREVAEAAVDCFWHTVFDMAKDQAIHEWELNTKAGTGHTFVEQIMRHMKVASISCLISNRESNEPFFDYRSVPELPELQSASGQSGNRTRRSKKRKNARRKA